MLNENERHQLNIIEHELETDDPALARTFAGWRAARRIRVVALLCAALAAGILVLAIVTAIFPLLFLAFLTAMTAACLHFTRHTKK